MNRNPASADDGNVICNEPGCTVSSAVADFTSMTLRTGLSYCTAHVNQHEVAANCINSP